MTPRVVHFQIYADDTNRARIFYESVFGWNMKKLPNVEEEYWLVETGPDTEPGINGAITQRKEKLFNTAPTAFVCIITVDDLDKYLQKVQFEGGEITQQKQFIEGYGWLAYCKDTENNTFGLFETKK